MHLADGVHPKDIGSKLTRWVRIIYIILILGVIGSHVPAQLHHLAQQSRRSPPHAESHDAAHDHQSALAASDSPPSFIILVITGFALKFPDSWFAEVLGMGEHLRSIVHRVAGVVLIAAGFYHVFYLAIANEGRRMLRDIAPRPEGPH